MNKSKNVSLLKVESLKVSFKTYLGTAKVLDNICFSIQKSAFFGLAGETGCGKSVTAYTIIKLLPPLAEITGGTVWFKGEDLITKSDADMHKKIRGREIALVLQNPQNALNPSVRIKDQMLEALQTHGSYRKPEAVDIIIDLLQKVKISDPRYRLEQYPHELSGGLQQRINTAISLLCSPSLLIADEFTTNLDVTTQAEVMKLALKIQQEMQMSILLITHDLALISEYCSHIGIIYAGQIVETGRVHEVFQGPTHPYTRGLMRCIPDVNMNVERLNVITGRVPNLIDPPAGCRFHTRCDAFLEGTCDQEMPPETKLTDSHSVWCHAC
jgi:oligopeptide/dipeptide ABC transporter ATP-binding protein